MKVRWFAGSEHVARMGPYPSQVAAWAALRAANTKMEIKHRILEVTDRRGDEHKFHIEDRRIVENWRVHVDGAYVWPEEVP